MYELSYFYNNTNGTNFDPEKQTTILKWKRRKYL